MHCLEGLIVSSAGMCVFCVEGLNMFCLGCVLRVTGPSFVLFVSVRAVSRVNVMSSNNKRDLSENLYK